jgi:hypothetical protein
MPPKRKRTTTFGKPKPQDPKPKKPRVANILETTDDNTIVPEQLRRNIDQYSEQDQDALKAWYGAGEYEELLRHVGLGGHPKRRVYERQLARDRVGNWNDPEYLQLDQDLTNERGIWEEEEKKGTVHHRERWRALGRDWQNLIKSIKAAVEKDDKDQAAARKERAEAAEREKEERISIDQEEPVAPPVPKPKALGMVELRSDILEYPAGARATLMSLYRRGRYASLLKYIGFEGHPKFKLVLARLKRDKTEENDPRRAELDTEANEEARKYAMANKSGDEIRMSGKWESLLSSMVRERGAPGKAPAKAPHPVPTEEEEEEEEGEKKEEGEEKKEEEKKTDIELTIAEHAKAYEDVQNQLTKDFEKTGAVLQVQGDIFQQEIITLGNLPKGTVVNKTARAKKQGGMTSPLNFSIDTPGTGAILGHWCEEQAGVAEKTGRVIPKLGPGQNKRGKKYFLDIVQQLEWNHDRYERNRVCYAYRHRFSDPEKKIDLYSYDSIRLRQSLYCCQLLSWAALYSSPYNPNDFWKMFIEAFCKYDLDLDKWATLEKGKVRPRDTVGYMLQREEQKAKKKKEGAGKRKEKKDKEKKKKKKKPVVPPATSPSIVPSIVQRLVDAGEEQPAAPAAPGPGVPPQEAVPSSVFEKVDNDALAAARRVSDRGKTLRNFRIRRGRAYSDWLLENRLIHSEANRKFFNEKVWNQNIPAPLRTPPKEKKKKKKIPVKPQPEPKDKEKEKRALVEPWKQFDYIPDDAGDQEAAEEEEDHREEVKEEKEGKAEDQPAPIPQRKKPTAAERNKARGRAPDMRGRPPAPYSYVAPRQPADFDLLEEEALGAGFVFADDLDQKYGDGGGGGNGGGNGGAPVPPVGPPPVPPVGPPPGPPGPPGGPQVPIEEKWRAELADMALENIRKIVCADNTVDALKVILGCNHPGRLPDAVIPNVQDSLVSNLANLELLKQHLANP